MVLDKHTAYHNLLEALPQPKCALCRLGHEVEVNYIENVLYSKTTAISTRAEWREARGLCLPHAEQLDQIGHALGVSLFYQDITLTVKEVLDQVSPQADKRRPPDKRRPQAIRKRDKRRLLEALAPKADKRRPAECPACAYRRTLETVYVETLLEHLDDPEFVAKLREAAPLCLPHFRHAVEIVSGVDRFQTLRDIQTEQWEGLIAELDEFIRKNDHRFQHESVGQEGTAWLRALDAIAGTRKF
jgi:hypothetical protein